MLADLFEHLFASLLIFSWCLQPATILLLISFRLLLTMQRPCRYAYICSACLCVNWAKLYFIHAAKRLPPHVDLTLQHPCCTCFLYCLFYVCIMFLQVLLCFFKCYYNLSTIFYVCFVSLFVLIYINHFTYFLACSQDASTASSIVDTLDNIPNLRRYDIAGRRQKFQTRGHCSTLSLVLPITPVCLCVSVFIFLSCYVCL